MVRRGLTLLALMLSASACVFRTLEADLDKIDDIAYLFAGDADSELLEFHSIVVVALEDPRAKRITSFRMLAGPGAFEIRARKKPHHFFAFADMNRDLRFQADEAYGWAADAQPLIPSERPDTGGLFIARSRCGDHTNFMACIRLYGSSTEFFDQT